MQGLWTAEWNKPKTEKSYSFHLESQPPIVWPEQYYLKGLTVAA